jgi:hypothetical protein
MPVACITQREKPIRRRRSSRFRHLETEIGEQCENASRSLPVADSPAAGPVDDVVAMIDGMYSRSGAAQNQRTAPSSSRQRRVPRAVLPFTCCHLCTSWVVRTPSC